MPFIYTYPDGNATIARLLVRSLIPEVASGIRQIDEDIVTARFRYDAWAYLRGIEVDFIRPGKPVENAFIESLNGRLRDECLNSHWFDSLDDARRTIHDWRCDYNERRPHSALGDRSPSEFAAELLGLGPEAPWKDPRRPGPGLDR